MLLVQVQYQGHLPRFVERLDLLAPLLISLNLILALLVRLSLILAHCCISHCSGLDARSPVHPHICGHHSRPYHQYLHSPKPPSLLCFNWKKKKKKNPKFYISNFKKKKKYIFFLLKKKNLKTQQRQKACIRRLLCRHNVSSSQAHRSNHLKHLNHHLTHHLNRSIHLRQMRHHHHLFRNEVFCRIPLFFFMEMKRK